MNKFIVLFLLLSVSLSLAQEDRSSDFYIAANNQASALSPVEQAKVELAIAEKEFQDLRDGASKDEENTDSRGFDEVNTIEDLDRLHARLFTILGPTMYGFSMGKQLYDFEDAIIKITVIEVVLTKLIEYEAKGKVLENLDDFKMHIENALRTVRRKSKATKTRNGYEFRFGIGRMHRNSRFLEYVDDYFVSSDAAGNIFVEPDDVLEEIDL